ncbi:MAG TPA: crossover junction endodeoxyribonuclease RuvC [Porphyromonadaceae bacterium]|nr:crossover junction endodeoxyribonuclease RuvC [Porphyromonadaceae bacterium]
MGKERKIILGIDPGTNVMGYGLLLVEEGKPHFLNMGVLLLGKFEDHYTKLGKIYDKVSFLIQEYKPQEMSIEAPFFGKNVQSMLKLGRAQGVAIASALHFSVPVFEYAPLKVKMSVVGNGGASKEQVSFMLQKILSIPKENMLPQMDATDALAVAFCHFQQSSHLEGKVKSLGSWKEFAMKNPSKVSGL